MSIEAMKQLIELYDKHCYNNDYGSIEFNRKHGYKFNEAIEALRTAIQQAEAKTDESVAWLDEMLADTKEVFDANGNETPQVVRDVIEYVASWIAVYNEKRHPAPGVPDALELPVEDGTEYDYCSGRSAGYAEGWNACRATMLTAQAQKG